MVVVVVVAVPVAVPVPPMKTCPSLAPGSDRLGGFSHESVVVVLVAVPVPVWVIVPAWWICPGMHDGSVGCLPARSLTRLVTWPSCRYPQLMLLLVLVLVPVESVVDVEITGTMPSVGTLAPSVWTWSPAEMVVAVPEEPMPANTC
jgi:hypothetical protein